MSNKDALASQIADSLNSKFKGQKIAYFLDGKSQTPTDIDEFISTGSSMLDLSISNQPNGGIAVGRITENKWFIFNRKISFRCTYIG